MPLAPSEPPKEGPEAKDHLGQSALAVQAQPSQQSQGAGTVQLRQHFK